MKIFRFPITGFISLIFVVSCTEKLDLEIVYENRDIKVERYTTSEITTSHEFIDITNKRWNKTERIYEANSGTIKYILVRNDSIIIKARDRFAYDLAAIKFGYKIILD